MPVLQSTEPSRVIPRTPPRPSKQLQKLVASAMADVSPSGDRLSLRTEVRAALEAGRQAPVDVQKESRRAQGTLNLYKALTHVTCVARHPFRSIQESIARAQGKPDRLRVCWVQKQDGPEVERAMRVLARLQAVTTPRPYPLDVTLFQNRHPNAFSVGAGKFGIHDGMMDARMTDDAVAFVLAHELAHDLHHDSEGMARLTDMQTRLQELARNLPRAARTAHDNVLEKEILALKREVESEADAEALRLMSRAGFDPVKGVDWFSRFPTGTEIGRAEHELDHPPLAKRIAAMRAQIVREQLTNTSTRAGTVR